ncbi:MAG: cytidylate kinase [Candidatus Contendobacter odensis]|uniref:Cytidylate kinase n=1 Tax=Candidatus Contendibacter odensensis TaxID=1400860 RepID=A0A2G6PGA5_9GAMM|nr:MAG: cytidylate kinase [Candidatus Contendobacter odensis]
MSHCVPVITVDGPSGVGKGTLCQWLAQHLGWHLLDSGALYRLTALSALRRNTPLDDEAQISAVANTLDVKFIPKEQDSVRVILEGDDVSDTIRSEACGNAASQVAVLPAVRNALLQRQRGFRQYPGLVADGRDMGTVIFPDANLKLFLTASAEERAKRRYKQLIKKGIDANLPCLVREIAERDKRDTQRAVSPLEPAIDAELVDTTQLGIQDVCKLVLTCITRRLTISVTP